MPIPEQNVGTLHALAYRCLGQPKIAETKMDEWNTEHPGLKITTGKKATDEQFPVSQVEALIPGDKLLSKMNLLRASQTDQSMWPGDVQSFAAKWEDWCEQTDRIDFTGLIERAFEDIDLAPNSPDVILADEAQDYSRLEYALLEKWGKGTQKLLLCADPDQAIYEWRGADPRIFLDHPVPEDHRRVLSQSYRVPKAVHKFAMNIIERIKQRDDVAYQPINEDGEVVHYNTTYKAPELLIKMCNEHARTGGSDSLMILASCDYMLAPLIALLRRQGIPFYNPYRKNQGKWNPLQRRRHTTSNIDRLLTFMLPGKPNLSPNEMLKHWTLLDIKHWMKDLRSGDIIRHGAKKRIDELVAVHNADPGKYPAYPGQWRDGMKFFREFIFQKPEDAGHALNRDLGWFLNSLLISKKQTYSYPVQVYKKLGQRDQCVCVPKCV